MQLDARTLLFCFSMVMALMALIILSMRRTVGGAVHGLVPFALGNVATTASTVLIAMRGSIPLWLSLVVGNALLLYGMALYIVASRRFDGGKARYAWTAMPPLAIAIGMVAFNWGVDSPVARQLCVLPPCMAGFLYAARSLLRGGPPTLGRVLTMGSFLGVGLICAVRLVAMALGIGANATLTGADKGAMALFIASTALGLMATVGFLLMVGERIQARLAYLGSHDALTGALNRGAFMELAERELARAEQGAAPVCLIMADLDHFKAINDKRGHQAGDEALRGFARAAAGALRVGDLFGRYGGEEFAMLLPQADAQTALAVAERVRRATEGIEVPEGAAPITVSAGVAQASLGEPSLEVLIARGDAALYAAKAAGRNRVEAARLDPQAPAP